MNVKKNKMVIFNRRYDRYGEVWLFVSDVESRYKNRWKDEAKSEGKRLNVECI